MRRKFSADTQLFDWQIGIQAQTFEEIDDAVTAPLHGFAGKDDYYQRCSSANFVRGIRVPTLILNALDDPFLSPNSIPSADMLPEKITLELSRRGGHIGFIEGGTPWRPRYYFPRRLLAFLDLQLSDENP